MLKTALFRTILSRTLLAVGTVGGLASGAALAAQDTPRLSVEPAAPLPGQPFQLAFSGEWPTGCAPQVRSSWAEGRDVWMQLESADPACKGGAPQALTLRSDSNGAAPLQLAEPGVYRLHVLGSEGGQTLAFDLLEVGDGSARIRPESGLWWPEVGGEFETSGPGLGTQIELQGEMLAVNVSGYGENGSPTWWFAAGRSGRPTLRLELSALQGGSGPFADYQAPKQVEAGGQLLIEWIDSARAVFWFIRRDAQLGGLDVRPLSMARFSFADRPGPGWRGDWVLLQRAGDGSVQSSSLRFDSFSETPSGFELSNADGIRLECRRNGDRPDSPPEACQLTDPQRNAAANFDDVGLERLKGRWESNAAAVSLVKLDLDD